MHELMTDGDLSTDQQDLPAPPAVTTAQPPESPDENPDNINWADFSWDGPNSNAAAFDWGAFQWDQLDWTGPNSDAAAFDWGQVQWDELDWNGPNSDASNIDWGEVAWNELDWTGANSDASNIDWGEVAWNELDWTGANSDAKAVDWGEVQWSELDRNDWDQLDWSNVQNEELDPNDLATVDAKDNLIAAKSKQGSTLDSQAGRDKLIGWIGRDTLIGGPDADELTGGKAPDVFRYRQLGDSRLRAPDRITDLQIGVDSIDAVTPVSAQNLRELGRVMSLTQAGIAKVLTPTVFPAFSAATFSLGSNRSVRTFLAINDGAAGFDATKDSIIELTGFTGNLANLSIT